MKTSCQSHSSSPEAGNLGPDFPLDGKLFDSFASLFQLAELHGGGVLRSIASDFDVALLQYQNNRTCNRISGFFINLRKQCQRMMQSRSISDEVREIFQKHLELIEQQIKNSHARKQEENAFVYDEEIFESCD